MSLPPSYFDDLYVASEDPWGLSSRQYEARKYAMTLAALPLPHYRRAFEPGCSVGALTRLLTARVDELVASDASPLALERARSLRQPSNVRLLQMTVPDEWPDGRFDLIVFSELGYYFDTADLTKFIERSAASLEPTGHLIAVHWRPDVPDYPGTAASVHSRLVNGDPFISFAHYEDEHFLLDVCATSKGAHIPSPES